MQFDSKKNQQLIMNDASNYRMASEEIAIRIFFRIYQCDNLINRTVAHALADHQLTSQQWAILGALSRSQLSGEMTVHELSRFLKVTRQNLTVILSRLEKLKLIRKVTSDKDARARIVSLTKTGNELWEIIGPPIRKIFVDLLSSSSFEENVAFLSQLNALLARIEKEQRPKAN